MVPTLCIESPRLFERTSFPSEKIEKMCLFYTQNKIGFQDGSTFCLLLRFVRTNLSTSFVEHYLVGTHENTVFGFAGKVLRRLDGSVVFTSWCIKGNTNPSSILKKETIIILNNLAKLIKNQSSTNLKMRFSNERNHTRSIIWTNQNGFPDQNPISEMLVWLRFF